MVGWLIFFPNISQKSENLLNLFLPEEGLSRFIILWGKPFENHSKIYFLREQGIQIVFFFYFLCPHIINGLPFIIDWLTMKRHRKPVQIALS